ncbi:Gfo/Idh/MocA family protein [Conexibacter woesei]|uniref:Oxidoreductase domain protein n=1 Tax=Conexibacter woesei (strain DSM 14684 / CCUG 47730 / CIP 108061 / JCM 11494 / NBRC 100937 / ID131577) TaxID=469383 RepID=D3FEK9_CONWI|nr:Gfo/Idh/MocA family oxidoreductase [Conexibacter woesei]ADB49683.1 oxidoreductase domain protein [Conexibacter woesei DSM 14684]
MSAPVAFAVIGAGFMGERWARVLGEHAGARVAVVADPDAARGAALAERCGARHVADAAEGASAPGVDAVVVCTPEHLHLDASLATLRAGRPLAVEKPLAHTAEQAEEIAAHAERAAVPVLAAHVLRFEPRYAAVKAAIARGEIGRVLAVRQERIGVAADRARLSARTTAALYYASHELDLARWYAGPLEAVHGAGDPAELLSGTLRFAGGAHGTIQVGWCLPDRTPGFGLAGVTVIGEHGVLRVTQGDSGLLAVGADGQLDADTAWAPELHGRLGGALAREADHFVAVAAGEQEPLCTAADGAAAVRASLALEASAGTGSTIQITTPPRRETGSPEETGVS